MTTMEKYPWWRESMLVGSHERPAMLFDWYFTGKLSDPGHLAYAVQDAWSYAKVPFSALGYDMWVFLFERAGYAIDGITAAQPTEPMTVYRSAQPRRVHRLAWTGTLDVARRFIKINGERYGDEHERFVYSITVPPERVLAHITDREEDEYIVNTRGIPAKRIDLQ